MSVVALPRRRLIFQSNFLARFFFLLLTPTLFRWLNFAFVWHSIYWGAITVVVLLWGGFILISPLLGRVGCGWFCFMGTVQDLVVGGTSHPKIGGPAKPWLKAAVLVGFFASATTFFLFNLHGGLIPGWRLDPTYLSTAFNDHYKYVWIYDTCGAALCALAFGRRKLCRACPMGTLCAAGARYSRLLPVLERDACNGCGMCERACPVVVPIQERAAQHHGLVVDGECLNCGACQAACAKGCLRLAFVWRRGDWEAKQSHSLSSSTCSERVR